MNYAWFMLFFILFCFCFFVFDQQLFSYCWDEFDYPGSIVCLFCCLTTFKMSNTIIYHLTLYYQSWKIQILTFIIWLMLMWVFSFMLLFPAINFPLPNISVSTLGQIMKSSRNIIYTLSLTCILFATIFKYTLSHYITTSCMK